MPATVQILGTGLPASLRALVAGVQARRTRTTTDRSLGRRLHAALAACGLPPCGLSVYVHDGAVSLYGGVPDEATREAYVALAAAQPGVRRIVDHLRVANA